MANLTLVRPTIVRIPHSELCPPRCSFPVPHSALRIRPVPHCPRLHHSPSPATLQGVNRLTKQELTVLLVVLGLFLLGLATKVIRTSQGPSESSQAAPK
jgi:hypothetical protein